MKPDGTSGKDGDLYKEEVLSLISQEYYTILEINE